jgi:intein/homing endonuclease
MKGGCFCSNTLIMLSKGVWQPISSLRVGMKITSYNEATKQFEQDEVTKVVTNEVRCEITITLENGERVRCTPNHLFLTVGGKWKRHEYRDGEERLRVGDELVGVDGQPQRIRQVEYRDIAAEKFFHICVKGNHNFVVGGGVIAHNMQIYVKYKNLIIFRFDISNNIKRMKQ